MRKLDSFYMLLVFISSFFFFEFFGFCFGLSLLEKFVCSGLEMSKQANNQTKILTHHYGQLKHQIRPFKDNVYRSSSLTHSRLLHSFLPVLLNPTLFPS